MKNMMLVLVSLWGLTAWANNIANVNKEGVMLSGYDPVSYFKSDQPREGDAKFQTKVGDVIYWFSSEENKQQFLKDPKKYEPQFDGWCAYAVADSKSKVEVDPKSFLIQDGRLLLFYKNWLLGNTREKWSKDSAAYLKKADANWPETSKTDP